MNINNNNTTTTTRHGNGTTQACAACKYQRRKCAPDCILAPYFPHDRQRQFLNAHKLFGVSNITKIIKNLNQPDKDEAMRTIIFQSDVRANDPVGGCYRIIRELQRLLEYNKAELDIVLHQLAICRAQAHQQQMSEATDPTINCEMVGVDPLSSYNNALQYHYLGPHQQEQFFVVNNHLQEDVNAWTTVQDSASTLSSLHVNKHGPDSECDDVKPVFDVSCERNEIKFEPEELIARSDEVTLRIDNATLKEDDGSIQQAQDHDLKGAATLFTLTNCNN